MADDVGDTRHEVTVVTALYDIKREKKGDGRPFEQYLEWFQKTLQLNAAMMIFVDPAEESFVWKHRPKNYPTKLVLAPFTSIPCYDMLDKMKRILKRWGTNKFYPFRTDLAMKLPEYPMIIHSKFGWMEQAMDCNPFKSKVFVWIDAGCSRFWNVKRDCHLDPTKSWPHASWVDAIDKSNCVWIQQTPLFRLPIIGTAAVGWTISRLHGATFAGNITVIRRLCKMMRKFLKHEMLERNRLDTEEVGLSILQSRHPEMFCTVYDRAPQSLLGQFVMPTFMHHPLTSTFIGTDKKKN